MPYVHYTFYCVIMHFLSVHTRYNLSLNDAKSKHIHTLSSCMFPCTETRIGIGVKSDPNANKQRPVNSVDRSIHTYIHTYIHTCIRTFYKHNEQTLRIAHATNSFGNKEEFMKPMNEFIDDNVDNCHFILDKLASVSSRKQVFLLNVYMHLCIYVCMHVCIYVCM